MPVDENLLRTQKVYAATIPLAGLVPDLNRITEVAVNWSKTRKRLLTWGLGTLVFAFVLMFIYWPAGLAAVAIGAFLLFRRKHFPKGVAEGDTKCAAVKALAGVLGTDTDPRTPFKVDVQFAAERQLIAEQPWPARARGKQKLFKVPWLSIEGRLLDGTTFTQEIEDVVRERTYRNANGKYKTKTRKQQVISLRFGYPPETYGNLRGASKRLQTEIRLPGAARLRGVESSERAVKLKALVTQESQVAETVAMLSLGVYRVMNLSRRAIVHQRSTRRDAQ